MQGSKGEQEQRTLDQAEEGPTNFAHMAYTSLGSLSSDSETGVGFDNQVVDSQVVDSQVVDSQVFVSQENDSDDENETKFKTKQRKPSFAKVEFVKSKEYVKTHRESVKEVENNKQAKYSRKNSQSPRGDNKGNEANAVKASACWVWRPKQKALDHGNPQLELQEKGVIDSGCSRHMTGNKSYLSDYKEIDGGFVAFGGDPKGGKITGKGKISTGKLDFKDVYFVKELKFNLFCVSQMRDKKKSVLFTDTECVVLSSDFKLLDKNHVLLRIPRKDNMYSVDLKNIVPSGGSNLVSLQRVTLMNLSFA
ncbi:hypothetical protein Tco_0730004 [Tanacetum coccineum]|uniref:Retrovirus-related Pol polyprotein from transposon TNT 1-94-like beta-barrel domain-containing protein n=1 Tax=Tanacetum coccineum TaxID=301880 RepID=A0ABQ4YU30_9ASTR